jgi:hypothetical protein
MFSMHGLTIHGKHGYGWNPPFAIVRLRVKGFGVAPNPSPIPPFGEGFGASLDLHLALHLALHLDLHHACGMVKIKVIRLTFGLE